MEGGGARNVFRLVLEFMMEMLGWGGGRKVKLKGHYYIKSAGHNRGSHLTSTSTVGAEKTDRCFISFSDCKPTSPAPATRHVFVG